MNARIMLLARCALIALASSSAAALAQAPAAQPKPAAPAPVTAVPAAKPAPPSLLMWQLRSPTATVYLLGSVHVGSADAYPLDPRIERAFAASDTLVLEVPLDQEAITKATTLMQRSGLYAPPDSLDKHIDPKTKAKLDAALGKTGLPPEAFMQMRPWFVAMTLALLRLQAEGFKPEHGIDMHFYSAAKGKRFDSLETIEEQAAMLSGMPEPLQLDNLRQTLAELDDIARIMREAFAAWRRGDTAAIDELMLAPFRKRYPKLYKRLFVERNRRMAAGVERLLAGKGTAFVVVGAGHLIGKDSIIQILGGRGLKATQQ